MHNDKKVEPFHIIIPKTSASLKSFDGQTKWMYFFIEGDKLLEKCNTICNKVSADIKKNLIASMSAIKNFFKRRYNPMIILQIFKSDLFSSNQIEFCSQKR